MTPRLRLLAAERGVALSGRRHLEDDAHARGEEGAMGEVCQNCLAIRS